MSNHYFVVSGQLQKKQILFCNNIRFAPDFIQIFSAYPPAIFFFGIKRTIEEERRKKWLVHQQKKNKIVTLTGNRKLPFDPKLKMKTPVTSNRKGWSLPIIWILIFIGLIVFLMYRYGWWWLGIPPALFFAVVIASIVIRGRKDPEREKFLQRLRLPLYGLFHIENIEQSSTGDYLYDIVPGFTDEYSSEEQEEIMKSMEAAIADTDMDFSEALPNLGFDDDDIRQHLRETLRRLREQVDVQGDVKG